MNHVNFSLYNNLVKDNVSFRYQYDECYHCLTQNVTLKALQNISLSLLIRRLVMWSVFVNRSQSNEKICSLNTTMDPGVTYNYSVQLRKMENDSKFNCSFTMDSSQIFDYLLPIYVLLISLGFCAALYYTVLMLYRHRILQRLGSRIFLYKVDLIEDFGRPGSLSNMATDDEYESSFTLNMNLTTERRLKGLDSFRGISIVMMVFVDYGGGGYWFFKHSIWNGITVADLVFPWFVFVMGMTFAISMYRSNRRIRKRFHWIKSWLKGGKRSIILFIIGIALESKNSKGKISMLRIMGPLQRLSIAYFCLVTAVCVLSYLQSKFKGERSLTEDQEILYSTSDINSSENQSLFCKCRILFNDILVCLPYISISFGLLLAHACLTLLLKVPNCPLGYLGPGGIGDHGCCTNCSGGVAGYIDRIILTPAHMYQNPTGKSLYKMTQVFDPEGFLGYLSCTAMCFIGYWAGNVILVNTDCSKAINRLVIYAVIYALIGVGLCEAKINGGFIPINKNLWSVSFVMVSAGTAFFGSAFFFTTVDVLKLWNGSPFKYPGMNPIVIYCGHILLQHMFPINWNVQSQYIFKLIMDIWGAIFWTAFGYIMFIKKIFITV